MGIPQITDRMKSAPTQLLRSVFAGIGRILLAADQQPEQATTTARQADAARQRPRNRRAADPSPVATSRWRSLDETGNVRLLSAEDLDDGFDGHRRPPRAQPPATDAAPTSSTEPTPTPAAEPTPVPAAELPLPSYDTLSFPSIRARLRSLDAGQLRALASYERSHAERQDVLGMLERRIEKIETGG